MRISKKVEITKTGIKRGVRGRCDSCPVARALIRLGFKDVAVYGDTVQATYHGHDFQADLPVKVQDFIERFDEESNPKKSMKPFSFVLNGNVDESEYAF